MDFSKQIQKAEEALKKRNYDFAVELFQQLLELDPDLGEARSGLRRALKLRQESRRGGRLLRVLSGAVPLATAKTLQKAKRYDACAKALESYLATNPLDEEANLMLGMVLEEAGHFRSARAVYEFLAEIAPRNPEGLKRAGAMMYRSGDHSRALEYYERALQAEPRDQEALKARKDLAAEAALSRTSIETAQHSRDMMADRSEAEGLERSRRLHLSEEELHKELERLETAYADSANNPDLMVAMAQVHERLRDYSTALEWIERALSYRKDSTELAARRSELRSKLLKKKIAQADKEGDSAQASQLERQLLDLEISDLGERVRLHPGDAALRLQLGKRLLRADRIDDALAEFQKAQGDSRVRREAAFYLGRSFQLKGFADLARAEYERALAGISDLDERAKETLYNLAGIAEDKQDGDAARSYYARIYSVDIGYRDVGAKMEKYR